MERIVLPVSQMINSSGLLESSLLDWLKSLDSRAGKVKIEELSEVELMQNELYWQLKKLHKSINECLKKGKEGVKMKKELSRNLEAFSEDMQRVLFS
jgi:ribosome-binding ATPase YchF (GTP1/OBG family)